MNKNSVQKFTRIGILILGILFLGFLFFYDSYYFDFDKIEHYRITEEIDYFDRKNDSVKIENKEILAEILFDRKPTKLNGPKLLNDIKSVESKMQDIPSSDFNEIREIFKEQSCSINKESSCISVFRDILVFYKKNKAVGIAKICFECNDNHIIGTTSNTTDFGQCGNFQKLNKILK